MNHEKIIIFLVLAPFIILLWMAMFALVGLLLEASGVASWIKDWLRNRKTK
jgi:predicted exporter